MLTRTKPLGSERLFHDALARVLSQWLQACTAQCTDLCLESFDFLVYMHVAINPCAKVLLLCALCQVLDGQALLGQLAK